MKAREKNRDIELIKSVGYFAKRNIIATNVRS